MKTRKRLSLFLVLAMVLSFAATSAFATGNSIPSYGGIQIQFGDPNYPATWPESNMAISGTATPYNAVYNVSGSSYYPSVLSMYAKNNFAVIRGSGVSFLTYNAEGMPEEHSEITRATNINNGVASDVYTLAIGSTGGSIGFYTSSTAPTPIVTLNFSAPNAPAATGGSVPATVCGYLQIDFIGGVRNY